MESARNYVFKSVQCSKTEFDTQDDSTCSLVITCECDGPKALSITFPDRRGKALHVLRKELIRECKFIGGVVAPDYKKEKDISKDSRCLCRVWGFPRLYFG